MSAPFYNRLPYAQNKIDRLPLAGSFRALPSDAFVIEAIVGDSQALGLASGTTLLDGTIVTAEGGLIWNKWIPGAAISRINSADVGTDFVPITANLGNSAADIGIEVSLARERIKHFKTGRYGLVKCAVSGVDVGLPSGSPLVSLSPVTPGGLFEGLIEGHLKPAIRWCYDNDLHPYLGNIYISVGGADAIGAIERAKSFAANLIAFARSLTQRLGLLQAPRIVVLKLPTDIPTATFPNQAEVRAQYPFISGRSSFSLVDYSNLLRQPDAVHLTAQGLYDLGHLLASVAARGTGNLLHVDNL